MLGFTEPRGWNHRAGGGPLPLAPHLGGQGRPQALPEAPDRGQL